jgi:hypothetical protein
MMPPLTVKRFAVFVVLATGLAAIDLYLINLSPYVAGGLIALMLKEG